jgi:hypothetical protein
MGICVCINREEVNPRKIMSQGELIKVIQMEQFEIKAKIEVINQEESKYLLNKENIKIYSIHTNNIKVYLSKIEENFFLVSLLSTLKMLEIRLNKEKYVGFESIREEFFIFYEKVKNAFDYDLLTKEYEKLNNLLDSNLTSRKFVVIREQEKEIFCSYFKKNKNI